MKTRLPTLFASQLLLVLASCGGGDPRALTDAGSAALNGGDPRLALRNFDAALAAMEGEAAHPQRLEASIGRVQALARIDPKRAVEDFLALAKSGAAVGDNDFSLVAWELMRANAMTQAVDLMHEGQLLHPQSKTMAELKEQVIAETKRKGDAGALKQLQGLGYL
ncbi:MAG: hypothetical protein ACK57N_04685 [Planctomycetia bacterium]|jgi:hypothetical protein